MPKLVPFADAAAERRPASRNTHASAAKMESARHRRRPSGLKYNKPLGVAFAARRLDVWSEEKERLGSLLTCYFIHQRKTCVTQR